MSNVSFGIKQDKTELQKQKVTVTSVAVVTTKFLFGTDDCTAENSKAWAILLVLGALNMCGQVHMGSHVSRHGLLHQCTYKGPPSFESGKCENGGMVNSYFKTLENCNFCMDISLLPSKNTLKC